MKLTVFNGSGRGNNSSTALLTDAFVKGFTSVEGNTGETYTLMHTQEMPGYTEAFGEAENVLLAFPMYTDMVPGVVKAFIETLQPYCGREANPSMIYLIHSGFPESDQLLALSAYLEKLSRRLGCRHVGVIRKTSTEGLREIPPEKAAGLLGLFESLGKTFAETGELDENIVARLSYPARLPGWVAAIYKLLSLTNKVNIGWDKQLKENDAFEERFAQPDLEHK